MSLQRLAIRVAAARALRGATLAEDRVFDSMIDPIDQTISEQRQPVCVVYTDEVDVPIDGRDLIHFTGQTNLVIELAIASRVEVDGEAQLSIPGTDEGIEVALDLMEHQALAALTGEGTEWSRVWMRMVPRITRYMSKRGAATENGVRFAARQITLTCDPISTPLAGGPVEAGTSWAALLAAMEADEDLAGLAQLLRQAVEGTTKPEWQRAANALGISLDGARAIGIAPFDLGADAAEEIETLVMVGDVDAELTVDAAIAQGVGPLAWLRGASAVSATASVV